MKPDSRVMLLLAGSAVALSVSLAGCSAAPDPVGWETEHPNADSAIAKVGDCRLEAASGLPADAEVVPCREPHDEEVFHAITLTGDTFSPDEVEAASAECIGDPFTAFLGLPKQESSLHVYTIAPTSETWDQANGRVLYCVIFDAAGKTTGSLAGVAR